MLGGTVLESASQIGQPGLSVGYGLAWSQWQVGIERAYLARVPDARCHRRIAGGDGHSGAGSAQRLALRDALYDVLPEFTVMTVEDPVARTSKFMQSLQRCTGLCLVHIAG